MQVGWFGIPWYVYALACLLVALGYSVFGIQPTKDYNWSMQPTWRFFVLRWLHSLVWILLCIASLVMYFRGEQGISWARPISLLSLVFYIIYLVCFFAEKSKATP